MQRSGLLWLLAILMLYASPVVADTAYVYTGHAYDSIYACAGGICVAGPIAGEFAPTGISGTFITSTPLSPNLSSANISPSYFAFSDGFKTLQSSTPVNGGMFGAFVISTDSLGNITTWSISVGSPSAVWDPHHFHSCGFVSPYSITTTSTEASSIDSSSCFHGPISGNMGPDFASAADNPGTWARIDDVPEPSSVLLVVTGLASIARLRKKVNG